MKFGEIVEGYNIPVLNEREIRAAAGVIFIFMLTAILNAIIVGEFLILKYTITIFLMDMSIRVFVHPKYSPFLIIGRFLVRKQTPLYVGAPQKRFAWMVGVVLSSTIFILLVLLNTYSVIIGLTCMICLLFLYFEMAFGICIACKFYSFIKKEKAQHCPGEVCDITQRHEIQKISKKQLLIVLATILFLFLVLALFNDSLKQDPSDLFKLF